jgi:glycosyltransferase involved in cell wall biosynthesis
VKVAIVAAATSIHTIRWAGGLAARGLDVHLISLHGPAPGLDPRVHWHPLRGRPPMAYLTAARELASLLRAIAPDLVNAHYASGYGTLVRWSGFRPTLLSVWGSDVYDFPRASPVHRWLLRGNLAAATAIASTSHAMARRVAELAPQAKVFVTPFGVDERAFVPGRADREDDALVIGTVKTLERRYGVDVLIEAFARVAGRLASRPQVRLEITGSGPQEQALRQQVDRLGIEALVTFHGAVAHAQVPRMLQRLDVFAALSRHESFGVAAIEAAACEKAIVVSDADGLAEVTRHMQTGWVVPKDDPAAAADALTALVRDAALRQSLGRAARAHVLRHYSWSRSLDLMVEAFEAVAGEHQAARTARLHPP